MLRVRPSITVSKQAILAEKDHLPGGGIQSLDGEGPSVRDQPGRAEDFRWNVPREGELLGYGLGVRAPGLLESRIQLVERFRVGFDGVVFQLLLEIRNGFLVLAKAVIDEPTKIVGVVVLWKIPLEPALRFGLAADRLVDQRQGALALAAIVRSPGLLIESGRLLDVGRNRVQPGRRQNDGHERCHGDVSHRGTVTPA